MSSSLAISSAPAKTTKAVFLERALEAVERIVDTVDDKELREALTADTDAAVLAALGLVRQFRGSTFAAKTDQLALARAHGEQAKRDLLAVQGDMLNADEVASRLGCDLAEVDKRRRAGLLIALPDERGKRGFPEWQFTEDGLLPGLDQVLAAIGVDSPWSKAVFFFSGDIRLDWRTPLDVLLSGDIEAVRRAAAAYGEHGAA